MPNFITDSKGKWHPAKENIGLRNESDTDIVYDGKVYKPGEYFVYDGPCREAVKMIKEEGGEDAETLGEDFTRRPDFLQVVRNMGFNNVDEYLHHFNYDAEKLQKDFEEKSASVKSHEPPTPVDEVLVLAGGRDTSGTKENDIVGGFGEQRMRKPSEVKKSKK